MSVNGAVIECCDTVSSVVVYVLCVLCTLYCFRSHYKINKSFRGVISILILLHINTQYYYGIVFLVLRAAPPIARGIVFTYGNLY